MKEHILKPKEGLVRLASWVPFGPAAQLLEALLGVRVSKASVRRLTLQVGEAGLEEWEEQQGCRDALEACSYQSHAAAQCGVQ